MNSYPAQDEPTEVFKGLLLGTAVGDALGLPAENLSPQRIRKWWSGKWRMRFIAGRGMISDDTEHALMVAQALLAHQDNPTFFQKSLAWKLRWWFAGLPGGVGLATAKACLRLWIGFPPSKAGVPSGGAGPAMRSAIIGAFFARDSEQRQRFVAASSQLTHRSWQAETAASAIAEAVALAMQHTHGQPEVHQLSKILKDLSSHDEWQTIISRLESSLDARHSVQEFADRMGMEKGVTGYSLHVVPIALYAWMRHPGDFRMAMSKAMECGGDTDTVGGILGALMGVTVGTKGIPVEWLNGICEWPRSISFMERIAVRLAKQKRSTHPVGAVRLFWPGVILRNFIFLMVVLAHGFRRLAPPY